MKVGDFNIDIKFYAVHLGVCIGQCLPPNLNIKT